MVKLWGSDLHEACDQKVVKTPMQNVAVRLGTLTLQPTVARQNMAQSIDWFLIAFSVQNKINVRW